MLRKLRSREVSEDTKIILSDDGQIRHPNVWDTLADDVIAALKGQHSPFCDGFSHRIGL